MTIKIIACCPSVKLKKKILFTFTLINVLLMLITGIHYMTYDIMILTVFPEQLDQYTHRDTHWHQHKSLYIYIWDNMLIMTRLLTLLLTLNRWEEAVTLLSVNLLSLLILVFKALGSVLLSQVNVLPFFFV